MDYSVEVLWRSSRSGKVELAYGKNLEYQQAQALVERIRSHGDWPELRKLIEEHEGRTFTYILNRIEVKDKTTQLTLLVS